MKYTGFHRLMKLIHREVRSSWQVHFGNEIIVDHIDQLRDAYRARGEAPPSYTAIVIKAIASAIREVSADYPEINSMLVGIPGWRRIHAFDRISAGVAISRVEDGKDSVVVGVIEDPDRLSLSDITQQLRRLATAPVRDVPGMRNCYYLYRAPLPVQWLMARMGRSMPELRRRYRGTFSITTVGKFGVDWQLSLPQAGSTIQFGFGSIRERPIVRDGKVIPAKTFNLSMSFERLLMNGKPCSILFERLRDILNNGEFDETTSNSLSEADQQAAQATPSEISTHVF